jgi:hypothetical protein
MRTELPAFPDWDGGTILIMLTPTLPDTRFRGRNTNVMLNAIRKGTVTAFFKRLLVLDCQSLEVEHFTINIAF